MEARQGRQLRALERFRGHSAERRYRGVYHYHRLRGWQPHPHRYAARRRLAEHPRAGPGNGGRQPPAPLHQQQHVASSRHLAHPRAMDQALELGQIASYDAASGTAMVQVLGSPTRVIGPVLVTACAPRDLTLAGASCLVALLDAHNPRDGVVAAVWPAPGTGAGTKLTQVGVASIGVAGASTGSITVPFPVAYGAAPAVVATSTDPSWTATVSAITTSGFTLTIHAAAPATATVAVDWLACGA